MNENITTAATQTEAPVATSAPAEVSTDNNSVQSSEKTQNTQETKQDVSTNTNSVPYDRFQETIKEKNELKAKLEAIEKERLEQQRVATLTPDEREQEQQLEVAKQTLKKMGFISQDELAQREQEQKAANLFIAECTRLEGVYNGENGMPKFEPSKVAEYMDELDAKGVHVPDPEMAFKMMNFDSIVDAKAKSMRSSTFSETQQNGIDQVNDARNSELEAATKTRDFKSFLKKYAGMPNN